MFNFKLQTLLDVRKTLEDKVLYEFSEKQKELQKEEEQLRAVQNQIVALIDALRNIEGKTVNIFDITMNTEEIRKCLMNEEMQKERVAKATMLLETHRETLLEAMKKRKAMEIIKTQHFDKYLLNMNRIEQSNSDEMTIVRHNRREEG